MGRSCTSSAVVTSRQNDKCEQHNTEILILITHEHRHTYRGCALSIFRSEPLTCDARLCVHSHANNQHILWAHLNVCANVNKTFLQLIHFTSDDDGSSSVRVYFAWRYIAHYHLQYRTLSHSVAHSKTLTDTQNGRKIDCCERGRSSCSAPNGLCSEGFSVALL